MRRYRERRQRRQRTSSRMRDCKKSPDPRKASAQRLPRGERLAPGVGMTASRTLTRFAARKVARRLSRSVPWVGSAIALLTLGGAIRRKGILGGTMNTMLDFIPFVGAVKNVAEMRRGRDFIPDRNVPA